MTTTWRTVLGFPHVEATGTGAAAAPDSSPGTDSTDSGDGAARQPRQTLGSIELHQEPPRELWARRALRALFVTVLVLLVFIGVRTIVRPAPTAAPLVIPAAVTYDRAGAQAVAARWATSYLTLAPGDAAQSARQTALAMDSAQGVDTSGGVSVTRAQAVQSVLPGSVDVATDGRSSVVTVLARVSASQQPARWVALAVPVGSDGTRPVVTATGAFVAFPAPGPVQTGSVLGDEDSALTAGTRNAVKAWLSAYGGTDTNALEAISAPGSSASPVGGLRLVSLDSWHVAAGDGHARTATALVTWSTAAGTIQQHYALTLSAVRSGDNTDWRVLSATATSTR